VATYEHDLLGSQVSLNGSDYRRTRAVRRGWIKGVGNELAQKSLTDAALGLATELGDYHPQIGHLPLQDIRIQRAGDDRAQYEAIYRHVNVNQGDSTSTVRITYAGKQGVEVPYYGEQDSGTRWTPNEYPPVRTLFSVPMWTVQRTVVVNSTSILNQIYSLTFPLINSTSFSIGGVNFAPGIARLESAETVFETNAIGDGVRITYLMDVRGTAYDESSDAYLYVPWARYRYKPENSRPYWSVQTIPDGATYNFNNLPGI